MSTPQNELVILVGCPASGKTTLYKTRFYPQGYVHVNRDTLKTMPKCLQLTNSSLGCGKSVVVDNTNPSVEARAKFIALGQKYKVPIRCIVLTTSKEAAKQYNQKREESKRVPNIAYAMYFKNFEQPDLKEGFTQIEKN